MAVFLRTRLSASQLNCKIFASQAEVTAEIQGTENTASCTPPPWELATCHADSFAVVQDLIIDSMILMDIRLDIIEYFVY